MERIDAHCHFWDMARGDYDWLANGPSELQPLRRTFAPPDLSALNDGARVIAVQAAATVAETRYLLSLAKAHRQIAGVVGWADLSRPETAEVLADLAADPIFRGIRPMLQDLEEDDWIATRPDKAVLQSMLKLGLRFDALVLTRHLGPLASFVSASPDLPVIVDHCAKPRMTGRQPDPDWRAGMRALGAYGHVHCKLSGLLTELSADLRRPEAALVAIRPVFDEVLDIFGPERLAWGSDWPVLTLAAEHQVWDQLTGRLLEGLSAGDRAAILGGTALKFYGIGGGNG